ncbi:protein of unknown function (plasmid) [Cupriavidus taiwanensis]|nr:protein of unknown function [Cupriavidus taiwanensis]
MCDVFVRALWVGLTDTSYTCVSHNNLPFFLAAARSVIYNMTNSSCS